MAEMVRQSFGGSPPYLKDTEAEFPRTGGQRRMMAWYGCWTKNRGIWPPKWMVKIMVPNPMNKWMIWGAHPYFWKHPYIMRCFDLCIMTLLMFSNDMVSQCNASLQFFETWINMGHVFRIFNMISAVRDWDITWGGLSWEVSSKCQALTSTFHVFAITSKFFTRRAVPCG